MNVNLQTMFANLAFSKNTRLTTDITSLATSFAVEDVSVLPPAPNYATIGTDENSETILYNAISGNELQNVERGIEGTAKSWSAGEIISRNFSNVDVVAFSNNISTIANYLNNHGNLFEYRKSSTAYIIGKCVQIPSIDDYIYLECVQSGTSSSGNITVTSIGELITDGSVKWLVLDIKDSAPVGTIKQDIVIRDGYLLLNGQIVNVADYPRLVNFLIANSLLNSYSSSPEITKFYYGDSNNETLKLPNFNNLFIENGSSALDGVSAGLPNITGKIDLLINPGQMVVMMTPEGAFSTENSENYNTTQSTSNQRQGKKTLVFNASSSNAIYGNSSTVQPPALTLIPLIKY